MSTADLRRFTGGTQDKGINIFEPDIGAEITWDESTVNVSGGIRRGVGPVYGISPLAGHADTETLAGVNMPGLMKAEQSSGTGFTKRTKIFRIIPLDLLRWSNFIRSSNHYAFVVAREDSGTYLDIVLGSISNGVASPVMIYDPTIRRGLATASVDGFSQDYEPMVELVKTQDSGKLNDLQALTQLLNSSSTEYISAIPVVVPGISVPMQNMLGKKVGATPALTTAPDINFNLVSTFSSGGTVICGANTEYQLQQFLSTERKMTFICLNAGAGQLMGYTVAVPANTTRFRAQLNLASGTSATSDNLNVDGLTATKFGSSTAYSDVVAALIQDPSAICDSSYKAILVASSTPVANIMQEWNRNINGTLSEWFDLTNNALIPPVIQTANYDEKGIPTATSFASFPEWDGANALVPVSGLQVSLVASTSGLLEDETDYELTYSIYYKRLNYETNVGVPVKFRTGNAGPYAMIISEPVTPAFTNYGNKLAASQTQLLPFLSGTPEYINLNHIQYRFYYRPLGSVEWIPTTQLDAALYWFGPTDDLTILDGPTAATTGGQPNGFNDYSPLVKDNYLQVLYYRNRAFWFSLKQMCFSNPNNIFSYATRNRFVIPEGTCRGGIVHVQPGELEQNSRIIIFGSTASYKARFTGVKQQQQIRVSFETTGFFDIDGSDFYIDYLCEATAYSYRAAVVAEGILYFWGPQGIYRDPGLDKPVKISGDLEPDILQAVDDSLVNEVHCVYNKRTSEIIWFYTPKVADAGYPTYGWVHNIENGKFYPLKFRFKVDSSQTINFTNDSTPAGIDGERVLLHGRETALTTVSRSFFFDTLCAAGQQGTGKEFQIKTVTSPTSTTRTLTPAAGSVSLTNFSVGDYVSFNNLVGYAPTIDTTNDFIAKVTAVNGTTNFTIELPDGAVLPNYSGSQPNYFPVFQRTAAGAGLHGITYNISTNYWLPDGVASSWVWEYLYMLFKYTGIPTPYDAFTRLPMGARIDMAYRTLVCRGLVTGDVLKLINNSDGHCQILHPLRNEGRGASGQALKYVLSGIHIGNPWTLEYMEAHCIPEKGYILKEFIG